MKDCISKEELLAQEMARRLDAPKGSFWQTAADRFKKTYGEKLLQDLPAGFKGCTFELDMYSNLTFEADGQTLFATMEAKGISLRAVYSKGNVYLYCDGEMTLQFRVAGSCSFPVKQYDYLGLTIERLTPIYSYGVLIDFGLELRVVGWKPATGATGHSDENCPVLVSVGGGDYWTGLFTTSRIVNGPLQGWKIAKGPPSNNLPLTAKWEAVYPSFQPLGLDAEMSEDSKFTLRVIPKKK